MIACERPAVVVLDMQTPVLDGRGFAQELKRRGWRIPIVVLTAELDIEGCARDVGAVAAIRKPYNFASLLATVDRIVSTLRARTRALRPRRRWPRWHRRPAHTFPSWGFAA